MEANEQREPFEERHFTVPELAEMWNLSREFVRQVVQGEPGVTEWVRQQPGRRRYRVLRVPQSVAERLYNRALGNSTAAHRLRDVIIGGEALDVTMLKAWYRQNAGHPARLVNMYGITETTVHVTYCPLTEADTERHGSPIGRRLPDLRTYILDANRQPVPIGVSGELYVGGAGVGRAYLNREALTAERFLPDPFVSDGVARFYRSGDVARWLEDGSIDFLGRNDRQIKIRGFRVELDEIAHRLEEIPDVREAVVVGQPGIDGTPVLVAYYTVDPMATVTPGAETLRPYLSSKLPEYMVPASYVALAALPLTANGKLDYRALPAPPSDAHLAQEYEAPVGETEATIAALWSEVLGLPRVGRRDQFFELGGHSLLAVTVIARLREAVCASLGVADLFRRPRLAEFAEFVLDQQIREIDPDHLANVLGLIQRPPKH